MFITFEGNDGGGKTTQAKLLADALRENHTVVSLREPGGTPVGQGIRQMLLDKSNNICSETELLLFFAARAQLVNQKIRPALGEGKIVICDRYVDSTMAYQVHGRGLKLPDVKKLHRIATGDLWPDLTVYLNIDYKIGLQRKGAVADRMESQGDEFYKRVDQGYKALIKEDNGKRFVTIETKDCTEQEVHQQVLNVVIQKIKEQNHECNI